MYVISLVFFGFAVRKYKDHYIPASLTMVLWFLLSALRARPAGVLLSHMELVAALEKLLFVIMIVLLLALCILRRKPLRLDWVPLTGTLLAAAIRGGWLCYYHWFSDHASGDVTAALQRFSMLLSWKNFLIQLVLCAVAVWHIYWMSRSRFIK